MRCLLLDLQWPTAAPSQSINESQLIILAARLLVPEPGVLAHSRSVVMDVETWLRMCCQLYEFDIRGVFRRHGTTTWPLTASSSDELEAALVEGAHILPLPKEPAALANVLEVSIVDFILGWLAKLEGADGRHGTERGYPDIERSGELFGGGYHAVDVKVAKRAINKRGVPTGNTQSRITLYTGNTYFRYPQLTWPGTFRAFDVLQSVTTIAGL